jgi:hypothetical protein
MHHPNIALPDHYMRRAGSFFYAAEINNAKSASSAIFCLFQFYQQTAPMESDDQIKIPSPHSLPSTAAN